MEGEVPATQVNFWDRFPGGRGGSCCRGSHWIKAAFLVISFAEDLNEQVGGIRKDLKGRGVAMQARLRTKTPLNLEKRTCVCPCSLQEC